MFSSTGSRFLENDGPPGSRYYRKYELPVRGRRNRPRFDFFQKMSRAGETAIDNKNTTHRWPPIREKMIVVHVAVDTWRTAVDTVRG